MFFFHVFNMCLRWSQKVIPFSAPACQSAINLKRKTPRLPRSFSDETSLYWGKVFKTTPGKGNACSFLSQEFWTRLKQQFVNPKRWGSLVWWFLLLAGVQLELFLATVQKELCQKSSESNEVFGHLCWEICRLGTVVWATVLKVWPEKLNRPIYTLWFDSDSDLNARRLKMWSFRDFEWDLLCGHGSYITQIWEFWMWSGQFWSCLLHLSLLLVLGSVVGLGWIADRIESFFLFYPAHSALKKWFTVFYFLFYFLVSSVCILFMDVACFLTFACALYLSM